MKFLDDLIETSARIADKSVKVAGEAFESAKTFAGGAYEKAQRKMTQASLENDLEKAQKQLGALYYLMRKTGEDNQELLDRHYREVAEIEEKLEALAAQEQAEKEVPVPAKEERPATEAPKAVPEEAAPAEESVTPEEPEMINCPICGSPIKASSIYCPICGAKIKD